MVQEKVLEGRATVSWISRCHDLADTFTHQYSAEQMKDMFEKSERTSSVSLAVQSEWCGRFDCRRRCYVNE